MDLIVRVKEIKGTCSVYKVGDTFKLKAGYRLVSGIPLFLLLVSPGAWADDYTRLKGSHSSKQ